MLQDILILQRREMEKRLGDCYVVRNVKKIADVEWFGKKAQVKILPIWKWMIEEN